MAYFNADKIPTPQNEYVCFLDIIGIQSRMLHSVKQTSNYIFKLHATILESIREGQYKNVSVYPIMDGAYISSTSKKSILNLLSRLFRELCLALREADFKHWYLIRASLSYGPIIHGRDIPYAASNEFTTKVGYKEQILIGSPVTWAYSNESFAPPMGIFFHDSALSSSDMMLHGHIDPNWKWHKDNELIKIDSAMINIFQGKFGEYYDWMYTHTPENEYPMSKRREHIKAFNNYFA